MIDIMSAMRKKTGFALAYVLFMVAILFLIGYTLVMMSRNTVSASFTYLDTSIAHFVAETGIEHAMYVLKWHKHTDKIPMLNGNSTLDINKKFGAFQAFADYQLPKDNPDDSWAPNAELKAANIETSVKALIPEAKINFIKLKFDPQKNMGDDNLTFGIMTISCQGEYRGIKRTVMVQKQVELYRDMSVMSDYCFAVNNPANETLPARRENNSWFAKDSALPNLTEASKWVPQDMIVNNGVKWNSDDKTPAKIFARDLTIEFNESRYKNALGLITGAMIPGLGADMFKQMSNDLARTSLLIKMHSKNVDDGVMASSSKFKDHIQHTASATELLGQDSIENIIDPKFYALCEHDLDIGPFSKLGQAILGTFSSTSGGSRGSIDLTGHFPKSEGWLAKLSGWISKGFNALFGIPENTPTVHNLIYGKVQRKFGYIEKDGLLNFFTAGLAGNHKNVVTENYDFSTSTAQNIPPNLPQSVAPGKLPFVYPKEVYEHIAKRHNTVMADLKTDSPDTLKYKNGDIKYFTSTVNEKFFENKKFKADTAFGLIKTEKEYKNVVWRPFWGWADSSDQCAKEFPWYTFSTSKTIFEAACAESRFAMKVDGIHFVDGDVLIEGFYKGRGAIVATGNIIIGGNIFRHPDDGVFDAGCNRNYEFYRGCYNCLQLVALGTKDASASNYGVTGKIIFAPHAYDNSSYSGVFSSIQAYWSERPYVRIDAYLYGEKGMLLDMDCVRDGFKFLGGSQDSYMTIYGNYTCQELNWKEKDEKNCYPDKTLIFKFQKWVDIYEEIKQQKYCTINFAKRSDMFIQKKEE